MNEEYEEEFNEVQKHFVEKAENEGLDQLANLISLVDHDQNLSEDWKDEAKKHNPEGDPIIQAFYEEVHELRPEENSNKEDTDSNQKSELEKLEELEELVDQYNAEYKEMSLAERKEFKDNIYRRVMRLEQQSSRNTVFNEMNGSKKELSNEFAEYCRNLSEEESQENLQQRYDEEILEKAEHLLENEHVLEKVKTVLDHRIAGEDVNKMGLFLQLLSKDTDDPLMIFGIQKQGEGKSYLAKNVIDLFPDHQVEKLTDATKSSIYRIAQDEGKDFFDNKIVFFGEIPEDEDDREVFQIFRQLNSEGEVSKRLVMGDSGNMESKKLELEGSPVVISTTVNEGLIDAQDMSRGMAYSPEMSKEQNEKVREYQNMESKYPEELLNPKKIEELEEVITAALDILSEDEVNLQNPFTDDMGNEIPKHSDNIKRDYPKTLKIASEMPAYLYHRQRPKREVLGNEKTFVHWSDVARGIVINKQFINNMIRGTTESTLNAYQKIKQEVEVAAASYGELRDLSDEREDLNWEFFENKDLERWLGCASQTAREYTRQLDRMQLVYKDTSTKPHRHYLANHEDSENVGITLRSLHNIIASVLDREEIGDWARRYYEMTDLEGDMGDVLDEVALTEQDLPVELDLGLKQSDDYPTPLYANSLQRSITEPTRLKLEMDGSIILCRFDSVSESFSEEQYEIGGEKETTSEKEKEESFRPQHEIVKAADDLDAIGETDGVKRNYDELLEASELDPGDFEEIFEKMESEGLIIEKQPGEYVLHKKLRPENVVMG
jgi:hypothetical protein